MKKLNEMIEKANSALDSKNYSSALVFYRFCLDKVSEQELPVLFAQLKYNYDLACEMSKQRNDAIVKAIQEKNVRRAYCVNKVNYNHMRLAKRVSEFLAVNPIEKKADGTFTKKYRSKIDGLKTELATLIDGSEIEVSINRYQYNDGMLSLNLLSRYALVDGSNQRYQTNENISANDARLLVLPVDRTGEQYWDVEKELKEKEKELSAIESRISELKRIIQE